MNCKFDPFTHEKRAGCGVKRGGREDTCEETSNDEKYIYFLQVVGITMTNKLVRLPELDVKILRTWTLDNHGADVY
jgi:hypothetical protein